MVPRGPDGAGVVARDRVALGHRRLRIIDLSENAQQPMVDSQLGLSIAGYRWYPPLLDSDDPDSVRAYSS